MEPCRSWLAADACCALVSSLSSRRALYLYVARAPFSPYCAHVRLRSLCSASPLRSATAQRMCQLRLPLLCLLSSFWAILAYRQLCACVANSCDRVSASGTRTCWCEAEPAPEVRMDACVRSQIRVTCPLAIDDLCFSDTLAATAQQARRRRGGI